MSLWTSDTGEANSWVLDVISSVNMDGAVNSPGNTVKGTVAAKYWGVARGVNESTPWAFQNKMQGDTWIFYAQANADIYLTFPGDVSTNPDLQYFKAGDVVQGESDWDQSKVWSNAGLAGGDNLDRWDNVFKKPVPPNLTGNDDYPVASANSNIDAEWEFNDGETLTGDIELLASSATTTGQTGGYINLKNSAGTVLHKVLTDAHIASPIWLGPFNVTDLKTIEIRIEGSARWRSSQLINIKLDGKWLVDTGISGAPSDEVKVISTGYPDSNTMVVDGGTWAQGDVVEYQTNGGEGEIVSVNTDDNTILLSETGDRDNRWIK